MELLIINERTHYPPVQLAEPPPKGYLHLAAVIEPPRGRTPFVRTSPRTTALTSRLKSLATHLETEHGVDKATVYRAAVIPPPTGYADQPHIHHARYDVVVLVETSTLDTLEVVKKSATYQAIWDTLTKASSDDHLMTARCIKSLGDVDKTRPGLYLFNYFVAENPEVALQLWEKLAPWFVTETKLTNSTVLQPIGDADYAFINHARWDYSLPRLMRHLFTKPSLRNYVQANTLINRTGTMPLLYRLA